MLKGYDKIILTIVTALVIIGLMAVYSSTSVVTADATSKDKAKNTASSQFNHVKKQLATTVLSIVALLIASALPINVIKKSAPFLIIIALVMLVLVFTPLGITAGGARRWVKLGFTSFQPSEFVKLAMVVFLSWYMSLQFYKQNNLKTFLIPIAVMACFSAIFIKQPDFGATVSLGILTTCMLFISGVKLRYLAGMFFCALPVVVWLAMTPYRLKRITTFLNPWEDARGSGFQLTQSFIALGSGGLKGVGLGEGKQKLFFLPEVHTDFIFALIGEELGFIGAIFVVILFMVLFVRGILIALKIQDSFCKYIATGLTVMIAVQSVINFMVVTGLAPTKGLPLPFISYGGSALLVNMTAIGLLLNVSRYAGVLTPQPLEDEGSTLLPQRNLPHYDLLTNGYGYSKLNPQTRMS